MSSPTSRTTGIHPKRRALALRTDAAYDVFAKARLTDARPAPKGGLATGTAVAWKWPNYDKSTKAWKSDDAKMSPAGRHASADDIDSADFDAIYFTGSRTR